MDSRERRRAVRAEIRERLRADAGAGKLGALPSYQQDYPGFWDVVAEEHADLASAPALDPPADSGRGAEAAPTRQDDGVAGAREDSPGERIGPYRLAEEIGRGGMGVVYRAVDTRMRRTVALKVLAPGFASSPSLRLRFRREAEAASRIDHPGICGVLDAEFEGDVAYLAMRFVEGRTLADLVAGERRSRGLEPGASAASIPGMERGAVEVAARRVEDAARALHAAHEAGLVHRDVKPGNIMITPAGSPVILDFGLARDAREDGDRLTRTGAALGTPAYLAPEVLATGAARADRRADVYALGVTLYELLALAAPFEAPTLDLLYRRILEEDPPDLRRRNPAVPRDLAVIVATALEKDPSRRYQSALDLAEDLRRWREGEPLRARPAGRLLRAIRWTRRNPAPAGLILSLAAGLAAAVLLGRENARQALRGRVSGLLAGAAAEADRDPALALHLARTARRMERSPATEEALDAAMAAAMEERRIASSGVFDAVDGIGAGGASILSLHGNAWGAWGLRLQGSAEPIGKDVPVPLGGERAERIEEWIARPGSGRVLLRTSLGRAVVLDAETGRFRILAGIDAPVEAVAAAEPREGEKGVALLLRRGQGGVLADLDPEGAGDARPLERVPGGDRFAWAAAGGVFAVAGKDGAARVWDSTGKVLLEGAAGGPEVTRGALSPEGNRMVLGRADGSLRVLRAGGAEEILPGPGGACSALGFDAAGVGFAAGFAGGAILLSGRPGDARVLPGGTGPVGAVAFLAKGGRWATSDAAGDVRVWRPDGTLQALLRGRAGPVRSLRACADGERLAVVAGDGRAGLFRPRDPDRFSWRCPGTTFAVPDGESGDVLASGRGPLDRLLGHGGSTPLLPVAWKWWWNFDAERMAVRAFAPADGDLRIHRFDGSLAAILPEGPSVEGVVLLADGRVSIVRPDGTFVLYGPDGSPRGDPIHLGAPPRLWFVDTSRGLRLLTAPPLPTGAPEAVQDLELRVDGAPPVPVRPGWFVRTAHFVGREGRFALYGKDRVSLRAPDGGPAEEWVLPDGIDTGKCRTAWDLPGESFLLGTPTGDLLLRRSGGAEVVRRRLPPAEGFLLSFLGQPNVATALAASPDGSRWAVGTDDGTIRIVDAALADRAVLRGHRSGVVSVAWSRGGRALASVDREGTVRWWRREEEDPLRRSRPLDILSGYDFDIGARYGDLLGEVGWERQGWGQAYRFRPWLEDEE